MRDATDIVLTAEGVWFAYGDRSGTGDRAKAGSTTEASEGRRDILRGVDLTVGKGELLCLLGANGCGKSTLLETLAGLNRPRLGRVTLDGRDVGSYSPVELARRVAVVFQDEGVPFPFGVMDTVKMGRAPYQSVFGSPGGDDERIALEALRQMGVEHLKDKVYNRMSGGERQMVLIARAVAQQTDVILMDEPTSHLDFKNQAMVMRAAYELANDRGLAVVMTTHSPYQAFLYPTKVALMRDGVLFAQGEAADVMTEENLSRTYDMRVSLKTVLDERTGAECVACTPMLDDDRYRNQGETK